MEFDTRVLSEVESCEFLAGRGLPVNLVQLVREESELRDIFGDGITPMAMKIVARGLSHKSDIGGVVLGVTTIDDAIHAFRRLVISAAEHVDQSDIIGVSVAPMVAGVAEIFIGVKQSDVFGPVILVGLGGVLVELLRDVSMRLCPVDEHEAEAMLNELRTAPLLRGYRGRPAADVPATVRLVAQMSRLAVEHPEIREADLNPVIVGRAADGAIPVDARVVIRHPAPAVAQ